MKNLKGGILILLVALMFISCTPSNGKTAENTADKTATVSGLEKVLKKKTLVVGCSPVVEGVSFQDTVTGEYVGMVPDIINGYAESLGVDVKWEPLEWATLIPATNTGKVDMIAAHMTMTTKRSASITFSDPWIMDAAMACVRTDSDINSLEDLNKKGVRIGSGEGSSYNELIPQLFPNAELVVLPTTSWQDALKTGRIDANFDDSISFPGPLSRNEGKFRLVPDKYGAFLYGFGVPLNDQVFVDSLNIYLASIKADGTYGDIYKKWFGVEWEPSSEGSSF